MDFFRKSVISFVLLLFTSLANANPVNINTANASALAAAINGVGPAKAAAIVEYRTENGPFKSIDGLLKVKGIGSKIVEMNKENLIIE